MVFDPNLHYQGNNNLHYMFYMKFFPIHLDIILDHILVLMTYRHLGNNNQLGKKWVLNFPTGNNFQLDKDSVCNLWFLPGNNNQQGIDLLLSVMNNNYRQDNQVKMTYRHLDNKNQLGML